MKIKLSALVFTLITMILIIGFGYVFYKFHTQSLLVIIGIICLMFIRHTYVAIYYTLKEKE
jgi:hypothetical protein